ncbi:putative CDC50/LEM3 family protein [Helianthus annuus]|uniref:ALA-interacting subunit n=1 Tax=Helianthus annuus TaxID=4232 RepID=A0A251T2U5_HELAN|nr:ALA-interacting subunit 3 [Helianthus annuus]KAF5778109.1 putative CDC50/LEM3 family protein [Helianthus annuus]KAJ0489544.1 putative CDC50/LEM3 family protein [Helianthus annuus]KAJ0505453.1 putative CDC50/LEM3 family protein [Helianthus annuus]KAJ0675127.1 putative CDC50/LEM3 family protein [Helianthus annuus]KAJ0862869.1 putative CDC50/LEM3 family protein [Helianthus annuus]
MDQKNKNSKKPVYSKFSQQELPAWKPILTPGWVIASYITIGALFIPIGLLAWTASDSVVEIVDRYDEACVPDDFSKNPQSYIQNPDIKKTCTRSIKVPKKLVAPIFVYYQLENFYQNHRRFVKSKSDKQLRDVKAENDTKFCLPVAYDYDNKPIVPCGLIAWSLFNDTYKISTRGKDISIEKKGIAWKSDAKAKFGSNVYPKNFQKDGLIGGATLDESIPLSEQEDLMVWMRTAALPTFRKLYGKINTDIEAHDTIKVEIQNNYNTYKFGGRKKLVLSTTTWIGGKNDFVGMAYISVGGICLFMAINFILLYVFRPRRLGDPSYLSWNRHPIT